MENDLKQKETATPQQTQTPQPLTGGDPYNDLQKNLALNANAISKLKRNTEASIGKLLKKARKTQKDVDKTQEIMRVVVVFLVIMVAGIVIAYIQLSISTSNTLIDKIDSLQIQVYSAHNR